MARTTEPDGAITGLERARALKRLKIKRDFGWHLATYMNHRWAYAAAASTAVAFGYRRVLRPWHERWGATDQEARAALPGDDLVADPATQSTRAITVHAPAGQVWPWVVQLGADRGGFYSYDWLENLFRLGIHSAAQVVPDWQRRAVGDLVYADAPGTGGWYVKQVVPNEVLVLQVANVAAGRPARRDEQLRWEFLWTFATKDQGDGTTRLLVRERVGFGSTATRLLMSPLGLVSFVMTRKMMRGIRARAEASAPQTTDAVLVAGDHVHRQSANIRSYRDTDTPFGDGPVQNGSVCAQLPRRSAPVVR
jgi:hypothetical protein